MMDSNLTYSEQVAISHVAYRRLSGWSVDQIADEAMACLKMTRVHQTEKISHLFECERAFARVHRAMETERLSLGSFAA